MDRLRGIAERQIEQGLARGMQLVVAHRGVVVVDESIGHAFAGGEPSGAAITPTTRFHIASSSKAITATAVHLLVEQGLVAYNDPVARHVEEFARHDKATITIRQLFTHQAGIPDLAGRAAPAILLGDWDAAVAAVCDLEPEYTPGDHVIYHGLTSNTILAEVVRRVSGRPFPEFCRTEILEPTGMGHTSWGLPDGVEATDTVGWDEAVEEEVRVWRAPAVRANVIPGGGAYSTARDLASLYLALPSILSPATVEHATRVHAPMAPGSPWGFGYGFMVGTDAAATLSRGNLGSPRVYGHPGYCFSQALCDPEHDLVMVFLANVAPTQFESDRRFGILCDTVYRAISERGSTLAP